MAKPSTRPQRSTRNGQQARSTIIFHAQSGPIERSRCGHKPCTWPSSSATAGNRPHHPALPPLQHWPTPPPHTRSSEVPRAEHCDSTIVAYPTRNGGKMAGL